MPRPSVVPAKLRDNDNVILGIQVQVLFDGFLRDLVAFEVPAAAVDKQRIVSRR